MTRTHRLRAGSHKFPRTNADFPNFADALHRHILPGFIPASPPLSRESIILTQGSCFARNVHQALLDAGVQSEHIGLQELANSPLANRLYFDYAAGLPYANESHRLAFQPKVLEQLRSTCGRASAMIFTVGVAYCPFENGALATSELSPDTIWRMTTVNENVEHLNAIIASVKRINPNILIIFTVSPIPLNRSFEQETAFISDCISKSTLRAAVAQALENAPENVRYWPSFEAIRWLSPHMGQFYGVEGEDHRHPGNSYIKAITDAFVQVYFQ